MSELFIKRFWPSKLAEIFANSEPKPKPVKKGKSFVLGIPDEIKPIRGLDPKAICKLVLSRDGFAKVVMQSDTQDSTFILEKRDDYWLVDAEVTREIIVK